ncbi:MAG: response regulator [Pseudomonadota bacterium]
MGYEILKGKKILAVDDEPDVLDIIREELASSEVVIAGDFHAAERYIRENDFDLVILDIMGVDGFTLLKACGERRLPASMLTAHAINAESLNTAMRLGAVSFLPKEELHRLPEFVAEIFEQLEKGETHWNKLFKRLGPFFKDRLGVDWDDLEKPPPYPPGYY